VRIGLLEPNTLFGRELRERLGTPRDDFAPDDLDDFVLLSRKEESVGTLIDIAGSAAVIAEYSPEALETVDVLVLCGEKFKDDALVVEEAPASCRIIATSADTPSDLGPTLLAPSLLAAFDRDDEAVDPSSQLLLTPHPGLLLIAHLLAPLQVLAPRSATATVLQPVSIFGQQALDALLEESKSILAFQPVVGALGGSQVSFNVSSSPIDGAALNFVARKLLGLPRLSIQILQAGLYHSLSASLFVELPDEDAIREIEEIYQGRAGFEVLEEDDPLSALDAAGNEEIRLRIDTSSSEEGFWIWATVDNLILSSDNLIDSLPGL
jgi:hypothetical protein